MSTEIRLATADDIEALAALHATSWDPREISVKLGLPYLRRFYREVVTSSDAFCNLFHADGTIVGYACGFSDYEAFSNRFAASNRDFLALRVFSGMLTARISIAEFRDVLGYSSALSALRDPTFHLGALALRPDAKGTELGGRAIKGAIGAVLEELERRGAHSYWGICDTRNIPMSRYLVKLGFDEIDRPAFRTKSVALFERVVCRD